MRKITNTQQNRAAGVAIQVPWRVSTVEALPLFRLYVRFEDDTNGIVDMAKFLERECGVFKVLRNVESFNAVYVEHGAVTWPDELDLAPDRMHDELQKIRLLCDELNKVLTLDGLWLGVPDYSINGPVVLL